MINQTLGHYRIVAQLGSGGMGVVYRARDLRLDRDVALKVLPPGTLSDEATRKQFRKEALALAKRRSIEKLHAMGLCFERLHTLFALSGYSEIPYDFER